MTTPRKKPDHSEQMQGSPALDRLDKALELTFPASDPVAIGAPTSTEALERPVVMLRDRRVGRADAAAVGKGPRSAQARDVDAAQPGKLVAQTWVQLLVLPWAFCMAMTLAAFSLPFTRPSDRSERDDRRPGGPDAE